MASNIIKASYITGLLEKKQQIESLISEPSKPKLETATKPISFTPIRQYFEEKITPSAPAPITNDKIEEPLAVPQKAIDLITQPPLITGIETVTDFWQLLFGSAAGKTEALTPYLPITPQYANAIQDYIKQGADEPSTGWQNAGMTTIPGVEPQPNFSLLDNLSSTIIFGAMILGALWLGGKYLEGRK